MSLNEIKILLQPSLHTQLRDLESVPKKDTEESSSWKIVQYYQKFKNLPHLYSNYVANKERTRMLEASYESLNQKLTLMTQKVETLELPFDIAKRDEYRQFFKQDLNTSKPAILELYKGIELLKQHVAATKVDALKQKLATLEKKINDAPTKMETHFTNVIQRQFMYKMSQDLRDLVTLFEAKVAPQALAGLTEEQKETLQQTKNVYAVSTLPVDKFKELIGRVRVLVKDEPAVASKLRALQFDLQRLDQPETLITELSKTPPPAKVDAPKILAEQLPKLVEMALAYETENNSIPFIFQDQPTDEIKVELLLAKLNAARSPSDQLESLPELSKEEKAVLQTVSLTDLTKLPPQTLLLHTKTILDIIEKGFANKGYDLPLDVVGLQSTINIAMELLIESKAQPQAVTLQGESPAQKISQSVVKLIDDAFACKLPNKAGILEKKLSPTEKKQLMAIKTNIVKSKDPNKVKALSAEAINLIDRGFMIELLPFGKTDVPSELKAVMNEIRANQKLIPK